MLVNQPDKEIELILDAAAIKFAGALNSSRRWPVNVHDEHHDFIEVLKKREEDRIKRRDRMREVFIHSSIGAIVLACVGGLSAIGVFVLKSFFKN